MEILQRFHGPEFFFFFLSPTYPNLLKPYSSQCLQTSSFQMWWQQHTQEARARNMEDADVGTSSRRRRGDIDKTGKSDKEAATPESDSNEGAILFQMGSR